MKWKIRLENGSMFVFDTEDTTIYDDHVAMKNAGTPYEYGKQTDADGVETPLESPIIEITEI
ncbi:MAG: hypothetical protein ACE5IJ_12040 [Thermoplasmata archaeon]